MLDQLGVMRPEMQKGAEAAWTTFRWIFEPVFVTANELASRFAG